MNEPFDDRPLIPSLAALVERAGAPVPQRAVDQWNPGRSGAIDIRIDGSGRWYYLGSEITRHQLVQLFSSILRREADGKFALVTPVEKLSIVVEDAPFMAVELAAEGTGANQILTVRTNVGDVVRLDSAHKLRFETEARHEGLKPYVMVRGGLEALATRALTFDLLALVGTRNGEGGIWSAGAFFPLPIPSEDDSDT